MLRKNFYKVLLNSFVIFVVGFLLGSILLSSISQKNFTDGLDRLEDRQGENSKEYKLLGITYAKAIKSSGSYTYEPTNGVFILPLIFSTVLTLLSIAYEVAHLKIKKNGTV